MYRYNVMELSSSAASAYHEHKYCVFTLCSLQSVLLTFRHELYVLELNTVEEFILRFY